THSLTQRFAQDVARNDVTLYFARTFTDTTDPHFAIPAFERKILRNAIAAENLHRTVDDTARPFRCDELRHGRLLAEVFATFGAPSRVQGEQSRVSDMDLVADQHPLNCLPTRQQCAERFALPGVFAGHLVRLDRNADATGCIRDPLPRQSVVRDGKPAVHL